MKIFFDFTSLQTHPCGISVYLSSLYRAMLKQDASLELTTGYNTLRSSSRKQVREIVDRLVSPNVQCRFHAFPGRFDASCIPLFGKMFEYRAADYDIVHFPSHICSSWTPFDSLENAVLSVHDMFAFHQNGLFSTTVDPFREAILRLLPEQARKVSRIITISEFSRREINRFLSVPLEKIVSIPLAPQWDMSQLTEKQKAFPPANYPQLSDKGYFLGVSALFKHKNWHTLLVAYSKYREKAGGNAVPLVIVGRPAESDVTAEVKNCAGVVHIPFASEDELLGLFSHAAGFFMLSYIEGFGLPLVEAMACGCPACYALGSSMDEIGRDAAFGVQAEDVDAVVEKFERFLDGGEELAARVEAGRRIAEEYSWSNTARRTLEVFAEVVGANK